MQEYMDGTAPNAGTPKRLVNALPSFTVTETSKHVSESYYLHFGVHHPSLSMLKL